MIDGPEDKIPLRGYYRFSFIDDDDRRLRWTRSWRARTAHRRSFPAVLLQPLGGAFGRVGAMETALGHRDAEWGIQVLAQWLEPEKDTANRNWVRAFTDALSPWARPAGFPNFIADGRRRRSGPRRLRRRALRAAGRGQGPLGPGERVPAQPQHRAEHIRPSRA